MAEKKSYFPSLPMEEVMERGYEPIGRAGLMVCDPLEHHLNLEYVAKEANKDIPDFKPDSYVVQWFIEENEGVNVHEEFIGITYPPVKVMNLYRFKSSLKEKVKGNKHYFVVQPLRKIQKGKILNFPKKQ